MTLITQNSRIVNKIFEFPGVVPTVPTTAATEDHTSLEWLSTDIYEGEIVVNTADEKIYTRIKGSIKQIFPSDLTAATAVVVVEDYNTLTSTTGNANAIYVVRDQRKAYYFDSFMSNYTSVFLNSGTTFWDDIVDRPVYSPSQIDTSVLFTQTNSGFTASDYLTSAQTYSFFVEKEEGKGLSSNDLTNELKAAILSGANEVYVFESTSFFPEIGDENTVYVAKNSQKIYIFDSVSLQYNEVGGSTATDDFYSEDVVLISGDWHSDLKTQTLLITSTTISNDAIIWCSPAPARTDFQNYSEYAIMAKENSTTGITFEYSATTAPTTNINVSVIIKN